MELVFMFLKEVLCSTSLQINTVKQLKKLGNSITITKNN